MTMNNYNIDFYVQCGKELLTCEEIDTNRVLDGDPEDHQYRKAVFPAYTCFMREIFAAEYEGVISKEEKITIFSQVKDFAIEYIYAYRHKMGVVAQAEVVVEEVVEETISEVEALRAQLAQLQADYIVVRDELQASKATNAVYANKLSNRRSVKIGNTITSVIVVESK
jgi:outer membrane murein-binding lipoprotein Lpp